MSTTDGSVLGTTKIVDAGLPTKRWNLVILSDGYRQAEMGQYAADAQQFANTLFVTPPFDRLRPAINVFRVDVASTDSGADDPSACGGTGSTARTYFDASFCNNGIRRLLEVNNMTVLNVANAQVPHWHMALVVVNSTVYGGSGGAVATFSKAPGAMEIAIHEMGHTAFGFADEYEYYAGCGVDVGHDHHPGAEPSQPNVTINANKDTIKWRGLIKTTTHIPTTKNLNCAVCDPQPSPVPAGTVGAFEGADYYHCGSYRPEFNCRMRALGNPFCAVCQQVIVQKLTNFLPPFGNRILETPTTFVNENDGVWLMADCDKDGIPDLVFIKTANTPGNKVEVHVASGISKYQTRILEKSTTFVNETDGVWLMADYDKDGIPDLVFIKTSNTPGNKVEVHIASGVSKYQTRILETPTTFTNEHDGVWLMADYDKDGIPDLVFIKTSNTPGNKVEVHIASGKSKYQTRILETPTTFVNENDGIWLMADYDKDGIPDLVFIKTSNTPGNKVEVHIASGKSKYQTRILEIATTFANETDGIWLMADYDKDGIPDLVFIKTANTPGNKVEVHVASGR